MPSGETETACQNSRSALTRCFGGLPAMIAELITVEWIHGAFQGSQVPPLHFRHIVIFLNSICLITLV
jgi:hypothetical protein